MTVGGDERDLNQKPVTSHFDKTPKAEQIYFVNCRVGLGPARMRDFAKLFGAGSVSGYTWWLVKQVFTVKIPKGAKEEVIKMAPDPFSPYTVEMFPIANILKSQTQGTVRDVIIVALYGSSDQSPASTVPIPFVGSKNHKAWTQATKRNIAATDAAAAGEDYEANPVPDFEQVTVTL